MVGVKTLLAVGLLLLSYLAVWASGRLDFSYLGRLDPGATFLAGMFASVGGVLLVRFWSLATPSATYFRVVRTDGRVRSTETQLFSVKSVQLVIGKGSEPPPRELPGLVRTCTYVLILLFVSLLSFDNRSVALLVTAPERLDPAVSQYCDETKEEETEDPNGPDSPGCRLVKRAYELGYAKSLGDCAPKPKEYGKEGVCLLRRKDEPYTHYAWRLLARRMGVVGEYVGGKGAGRFFRRLGTQWDFMGTLYDLQRNAVAASPRASHHIWTNLENPRGRFVGWLADAFQPRRCIENSSHGPLSIGEPQWTAQDGELLTHALTQLVFAPRYRPIVGYCPEYIVHWGASAEACIELATNPGEFLDDSGALEGVGAVIGRHRSLKDLDRLAEALSAEDALSSSTDAARVQEQHGRPAAPLESIVSFQCFIVEDRPAADLAAHMFTFAKSSWVARDIRVPKTSKGPAVYEYLAQILAPGFRYGRLLSAESVTKREDDLVRPEQLESADFPLSRLELLRDADLFLGYDWLGTERDLLTVYPHHVHVKNFVEIFRRRYAPQRGRL